MESLRPLIAPLLLAAVGLVPLASGSDAQGLATWLALVAPALGVVAGSRPVAGRLLPPVLAWMVALAWASARPGGLPRPDLAGLALAALYSFGAALGALCGAPAWRTAAGVLLATGLLAALATGGGALAEPWPPPLAARLLDLSPVGFALESGGLDWMRDPSIYEPAGTASIGPELRVAWKGARAAPAALVAGLLALVAARALAARRRVVSDA